MLKRLLMIMLAAVPAAHAAEDAAAELQGFEAYADILPGDTGFLSTPAKKSFRQKSIIPVIKSAIPEAAAYNIRNAEQVFCYHVTKRPKEYTGYTLSSFAITGYCGELDNSSTVTSYEALFTQGPNIINTQADCRIEPKIMLRFVRGVDYTDVLLSSPCPSFTVFYGGRYKSFNIKQGVINDLISQFDQNNQPFHSPSLLKQTAANGTANTDAEADELEKKQKELEPQMKWKQAEDSEKEKPEPKPQSGWGNLKLRM